jgi:hypothetical protein
VGLRTRPTRDSVRMTEQPWNRSIFLVDCFAAYLYPTPTPFISDSHCASLFMIYTLAFTVSHSLIALRTAIVKLSISQVECIGWLVPVMCLLMQQFLPVWCSRHKQSSSNRQRWVLRRSQYLLRNIQRSCFDVVNRRMSRVISVNQGQRSPLTAVDI